MWLDCRFTSKKKTQDDGVTLLAVIIVVVAATLVAAGIFSLLWRSFYSVRYEINQTQALYNARMGVDAVIELVKKDITNNDFTSSGYTQLQTDVNADLGQMTNPPFQASITVDSPTTQNNQTTLMAHIHSAGFDSSAGKVGAGVQLNLSATLVQAVTSSGGGGSGGTGTTPTSVNLSNFGYGIADLSVSGTGGTPINLSGGSGGSIVVNGSTTTVTGFPNLQQITTSSNGSINGTAWLSGDGATDFGHVSGTAILTGTGNTLNGSVNGTAIVTGSNAVLNGAVNGPALLLGSGTQVDGSVGCSLVTADNVTISGTVHGDLIVTGNNCTVTGSVDGSVVVTGNNLHIGGQIANRTGDLTDASGKSYALYATGTGEVIGGTINGNAIEYNNNVTSGKVSGTIYPYTGQTVVMNSDCLGTVQLNFSTSGNSQITVNFSSATITG